MDVLDYIINLTDSEFIIQNGYLFIMFIVFAESGLFFGFFLPGDYMLFLAGLFCANNAIEINIFIFVLLLIVSGTLGNIVGFLFGFRVGKAMYTWKDSWFFKKKFLTQAEEFYKKRGKLALIVGKFFPIIRTFAPIIAGIIKMNYRKFIYLNLVGNILWIGILCLSGYYVGYKFPWIKDYVHYIIIGFIVVTLTPFFWVIIRKRLSAKKV